MFADDSTQRANVQKIILTQMQKEVNKLKIGKGK